MPERLKSLWAGSHVVQRGKLSPGYDVRGEGLTPSEGIGSLEEAARDKTVGLLHNYTTVSIKASLTSI